MFENEKIVELLPLTINYNNEVNKYSLGWDPL